MRKFLLATTALVGFAVTGAAQAATAPVTVNVGGDVDFLAANFVGANHGNNTTKGDSSANRSFETLYGLNFTVNGKANNGLEYGGVLGLTNAPDISNYWAGTQSTYLNAGYVFLSGALGKLQLGDSHGATDLSLLAPVAGEGQVYGRFIDFLDTTSFAKTFLAGVDVSDHSTNVTYFTPKVGNENNKVQAGVTFVPQFYNYGSNTVQYNTTTTNAVGAGTDKNSPYHDVVKGAVAYEGKFAPVAVKASADVITGSSSATNFSSGWLVTSPLGTVSDFTAWGLGAQAAYEGFTLGGNYHDNGHYDAVNTQDKNQHTYAAALKYEFNKATVGVSYLGGEGYDNTLNLTSPGTGSSTNYVKDFNSYGAGGSYAWAPGLTSNLDGVYFAQKTDTAVSNKGYVLLVSQKLAF